MVQQGRLEEGLTQFRQGWTEQQATGARLNRTYHLAFLAETCGKMGQTTEGLTLVKEALAVIQTTQEAWWEAELYRLKGELTLQQLKVQGSTSDVTISPASGGYSPEAEVEACFLKAIAVAQKQQAKSLELRAVMSLVRLRQQQAALESRDTHHVTRAKLDEVHRLLLEIYHWFTEGFDTKDLQEAKALLEELRQQ
jgi:predicted ATPase